MSKRNADKPDYKETRVGWIPKNWNEKTLSDVCKSIHDGTHFTPKYVEEGIAFYSVENVSANDFENTKYISEEEHNRLIQRCRPEKGDILMTRIGTLGVTKLIDWDVDASIYVSLALLKPSGNISTEYLYAYTLSKEFVNSVKRRSLLNATPQKINLGDIGTIPIPTPPLPEQRKIAEILSTWDKAIALVGKQIEAKQQLKKGLMQQLLIGKVRFPGNAGEWKTVKLKQLTKLLVSNVDKKMLPDETPVVLCNYMDVYENEYITTVVDFMPATATKAEIKKFSLQVGDVILTKDSETREDIASTAVVTQIVDNLVCGYHLAILRPNTQKVDSIFLAKLLAQGRTHHHFVAYANGATRFGLTISAIENAKAKTPSIGEQKRIAQVFLTLDKEIELLGRKVETLWQQKRGLMQKLLTGEVRVKV